MADNMTDKEALKAQKEAEKAAEKAKKERIKQSKPKKEGTVASRAAGGIKKYWKDFTGTCKKIVWPTGKQVVKNSGVTLVTIVLIGLIVFGFDWGLKKVFELAQTGVVQMAESNAQADEADDATADDAATKTDATENDADEATADDATADDAQADAATNEDAAQAEE